MSEGTPLWQLFCDTCNGRGRITRYDFAGEPDESPCPDCKGVDVSRVYAPDTEDPWAVPALGYSDNTSSGWSGSDTSRARAATEDASGVTAQRQLQALRLMREAQSEGVTWRDVADALGLHHGSASSVLSNLHKEGVVARVTTTRDRCKVYVLPEFVNGRDTEPHGRKPRACPNCGTEVA